MSARFSQDLAGMSVRILHEFVRMSARFLQDLARMSVRFLHEFVRMSARFLQDLAGMSARFLQHLIRMSARFLQEFLPGSYKISIFSQPGLLRNKRLAVFWLKDLQLPNEIRSWHIMKLTTTSQAIVLKRRDITITYSISTIEIYLKCRKL